MHRILPLLLAAVLLTVSPVLAVKTQFFKQATAADFRGGTARGVGITDSGEIVLGRAVASLLPKNVSVGSITAMTVGPDDSLYYAAFPACTVNKIKDGKTQSLVTIKDEPITALAVDGRGDVLMALTGEGGRVMRLSKAGGKPQKVFSRDGVDYIWSILPQKDGGMLLATGPNGIIYSVDANDDAKPLAKLEGTNVTALLQSDDQLYAGTDDEGLVYSIDRATGKHKLLFDAAESEIVALALDSNGDLLAAATDGKAGEQSETAADASEQSAPTPQSGKGAKNNRAADAGHPERPAPAAAEPQATTQPAARHSTAGPVQPAAGEENGEQSTSNAVYRIHRDGSVSELFRTPAAIHSMACDGKYVLIGTGDSGDLYQLELGSEQPIIAAHVDGKQINYIAVSPATDQAARRVRLAASNPGSLYEINGQSPTGGTFQSAVLDTGTISSFGAIHIRGELPEDLLQLSARTGNAAEPESGNWSEWSTPSPAHEYNKTKLPPGRFVQYRLIFKPAKREQAAKIDGVSLAYQNPNIAPRVSSVTVTPTEEPASPGDYLINWTATDANSDALRFSIDYRIANRGDWVELAKDIDANSYTWHSKNAADGQYEFKVVASDSGDNQPGDGKTASRVSSAVDIDHAPPTITDIVTSEKAAPPTIKLRVVDRGGTVASLAYSIDRADHWQKQLPDDTIADSPEEKFTLSLGELGKGSHTITLRATDESGNLAFEIVTVKVPGH